jgi:hypothetical protein
MKQDDRSQNRRWGALAGLSAAAGAALAAAMIPAAPAFADPTDDAVAAAAITGGGGGTTETEDQILGSDVIADAGGSGSTANLDEAAINTALGLFPGGVNGTDATGVETFLVDHPNDLAGLVNIDTGLFDHGAPAGLVDLADALAVGVPVHDILAGLLP